MKELSIEEKAKRYDDLLVKLQEAKVDNDVCDERYCCVIDNIVPELKESDGERIRKNLIELFHDTVSNDEIFSDYGLDKTEVLDWLEKQGEQKSAKNILEAWKDMRFEVYQQASGNRHEPNYSDDTTKMFSLNDIDEIIEKMSEQKPFDYENANIQHKDFAPKVEPKFKNGQWIVWQDKCYKVNYNGCGYELIDQDGLSTSLEYSTIDDNAHFLTIQDAKDGDMIYVSTEEKGIQAIFYKYEGGIIYFHCNLCGDFIADGYMPIGAIEFVSPLQKVHYQRFFEKMHEAGYEWDADTLELKKIEQKPAWSEEDKVMLDEIIDFFENGTVKLQHDLSLYASWLKSLTGRYTWKPSDEQMDVLLSEVTAWTKGCPKQIVLESLYNDLKKLKG